MDAGNGALLSLLTVLVALIAVAMVIQAIAVLVFVMSFRKSASRLEVLINQITHDVQPVLSSAREILSEGRTTLTAISANLLDITGMIKEQVARLDAMVTDASERTRAQFIRLDQLLGDTVTRMEETGEVVRLSILKPVREISAILAGVRTTLEFLRRRNKAGAERVTQDEELFI